MAEAGVNPPPSPRTVNRWVWISLGLIIFLFLIMRVVSFSTERDGLSLGGKVGIVKLEGPIISSEKVVRDLDDFAERSDIKAIVFRINSPGGSVAPSQEIYEKVKSLKGVKPVVVSVGTVAASGGYYTALGSERIVGNRGSIIGSIGVILEYPVAVELLDKIGLRFETIKSGEMKDMGNPSREVTDKDREVFRDVVRDLHHQFIEAVSEGREMNRETVETLADGRVFTGEQSLDLGLIDTLGTLEDAITLAGNLGRITGKPKTVQHRKKRPGILDYLFGEMKQTAGIRYHTEPVYRWR